MSAPRPNIVLFIAEHWRGDSLGVLGHPVAETPHIDELAGRGVTFTEAYTPCPSCIAARRSLMTGQTPTTHGMLGYRDGCPWPYRRTLAGELARAGYQTINVGKTHFHPARLHLGFEQLIVPEDYAEWIQERTGLVRPRFAHGVHGNSWMARPAHLPEAELEETWLTNEAMKRLVKRDPERPFFLCLSYNGVHPPLCPPQVYWDMFIHKDIPPPVEGAWSTRHAEEPRHPLDVNAWRGKISPELNHRVRAAYYAYMAYVDAQIGRFVEFIGRSGWGRDTMYVFTADHGEMLGDHNLWRKTYAYDASARIPFVVVPPRALDVEGNVRTRALAGLEDIMPTLLESVGAEVPATVEGRSLLPVLRGDRGSGREHYHHEHSPCYAPDNAYHSITTGAWKYVWNPISGAEQLFNREDDVHDLNDLAADPARAEALAGLRALLAKELEGRPEGFSDGRQLATAAYPVWREPTPAGP